MDSLVDFVIDAVKAAAGHAKIPIVIAKIKDAVLPTVTQDQAEQLVAKAHTICPYSKATRGNIEVNLMANGVSVNSGL